MRCDARTRRGRFATVVSATLVVALLAAGTAAAGTRTSKLVPLKFSVVPSLNFAATYAAIDAGIFAKHGIDATIDPARMPSSRSRRAPTTSA